MPFISIDYFTGVTPLRRRQLQERLGQAVVEAFGSPPGNVRVFTRAVDPADTYTPGGDQAGTLPVIRAEFLPGRTYEQKKSLMAGLAAAASEVLQLPVGQIRTILYEKDRRDWARGSLPVEEA